MPFSTLGLKKLSGSLLHFRSYGLTPIWPTFCKETLWDMWLCSCCYVYSYTDQGPFIYHLTTPALQNKSELESIYTTSQIQEQPDKSRISLKRIHDPKDEYMLTSMMYECFFIRDFWIFSIFLNVRKQDILPFKKHIVFKE